MWKKLIHTIEAIHLKHPSQSVFDWGIDYLTDSVVTDPAGYLDSYVAEAIQNSEQYFAYQPQGNFALDGNKLIFPTPLEYPKQYESNRKALAQFFPSSRAGRAVIVVPYLGAPPASYLTICRALNKFGYSVLRLTMPYHEQRGMDSYEKTNDMVSANLGRTIQGVRQAVVEIRALAHWLNDNGYSSIGVMGTSLGSCAAVIAAAHEPLIQSLFAIHMSSNFGDVVWTGRSTAHIRAGFEGNIDQEATRRYWSVISPLPYIKRFARRDPHHFILAGIHDITFHYHLTEQVFAEYKRYGIPLQYRVLPVGHFTLRYTPFQEYTFALLLQHFRRTL